MRRSLKKWILCQSVVAALWLVGSPVLAQKSCNPPAPCANCPSGPGAVPSMPGAESPIPPQESPIPPMTSGAEASPDAGAAAPLFAGLGAGAGVGSSAALAAPGGYLDSAIPQTQFRLRNDAEFGTNRFDRAEYMYGTWAEASFHTHAFVNNGSVHGTFVDPHLRGTRINSDSVNADILTASMEVAINQRFSAFVEMPYEFVHFGRDIEESRPESTAERNQFLEKGENRNPNFHPNGMSDLHAGFKFALIADPDNQYLTFQLRGYCPTGDEIRGLGTGHYSIEPSLLYYQRLSEQMVVQGQLTYWAPITEAPGAGDVFQYGFGIGYDVIQRPCFRLTPVAELVGWTVIGGTEAIGDGTVPAPAITTRTGATAVNVGGVIVPDDHFFQSATGDTIINAKIGVRTYFGEGNDVYVGYGHSLTGDRWYKDIVRLEYRRSF